MSCSDCVFCFLQIVFRESQFDVLQNPSIFYGRSRSSRTWPHCICLTGKWVVDGGNPFFLEEHKKLDKKYSDDKQVGKPIHVWEEELAGGHQKLQAPFLRMAEKS